MFRNVPGFSMFLVLSTAILKGFLHQSLFQVLLLSSIYSSQREYLFIVFYNNTHSFISFYSYKALIISLPIPEGICLQLHNTALQLFQLFG